MKHRWSIGTFAKMLNVRVETLRNWEKKGIIVAYRTPTNRRYYTEEHIEKLNKLERKQHGTSL